MPRQAPSQGNGKQTLKKDFSTNIQKSDIEEVITFCLKRLRKNLIRLTIPRSRLPIDDLPKVLKMLKLAGWSGQATLSNDKYILNFTKDGEEKQSELTTKLIASNINLITSYVLDSIKAKQAAEAVKRSSHEISYPRPQDVLKARLKAETRPNPVFAFTDYMLKDPHFATSAFILERLEKGQTNFMIPKTITNKGTLYNVLTLIESRGGWASTKVATLSGANELQFKQHDVQNVRQTYRRQPGEACVWG
jgi:hypothetical protein